MSSAAPFDQATQQWFDARARQVRVPAGTRLFGQGAACESFVLLGAGTVRVQTTSRSGREIVLYRVGAGETCVMTNACLLSEQPYAAEGLAETECLLHMLAAADFAELMRQSPSFQRFVFAASGQRVVDLVLLFEEVVFERIDARLAAFLLQRGQELDLTHQEIASELGTSREVVSRQLKEFDRHGLVALQRRRVAVLDRAGLARLAEGS